MLWTSKTSGRRSSGRKRQKEEGEDYRKGRWWVWSTDDDTGNEKDRSGRGGSTSKHERGIRVGKGAKRLYLTEPPEKQWKYWSGMPATTCALLLLHCHPSLSLFRVIPSCSLSFASLSFSSPQPFLFLPFGIPLFIFFTSLLPFHIFVFAVYHV